MKQLFSTALDLAGVRPVQSGPVGEDVLRPSVFLPQRPNVGPDFSLDDLYQEQFEATGDFPTGPLSTGANNEPTPALCAPLEKPLSGADLPRADILTPAPDNPDHPDSLTVYYHQPSDRGPRHARFPEINVSATAKAHGMSKSQLSRLLNGENCPSLKSLFLLSAILKLPVEEVAEMYRTRSGKPVRGKVQESETTMTTTLPAIARPQLDRAIATCLAGLSPNTQRAYKTGIKSFQAWCNQPAPGTPPRRLNRESVSLWAQNLTARGQSGIAVNQALSAMKRLATEAANLGSLDWESVVQIQSIKSRKYKGIKTSRWLTLAQVKMLIAAPDRTTLIGKRDAACLALLVGCGLGRQEACELPAQQIGWKLTEKGPVMQISNLNGKGNRVRTLQVPAWAARDIDDWITNGKVTSGKLMRSVPGASLSPSAIRDIVAHHATLIGVPGLAPHDLRRTMARLARDGGASLEVIQQTLGHASVQTTERYIKSTTSADAGNFIDINAAQQNP